ncbi:SAM-dependent methyltransferase [Prosthecomicrobium pneumaticum]|uniref:Cyclopropane-fatty-acyl-phospholipid synthase n=1 Tax=Prosthecomicrobium pneumaticum TaxID=81895 RepID=A0A7W9CU09_9HYPH|nr:cyclopropane-fatty-acyl-phospholipid synthase family protein [Prosthecomicrobium pneumaticum]MBB5751521.1 cyclopropane-fatty-acyl-phospholipid synthase [Prosthecomicrobium pneumaticum]
MSVVASAIRTVERTPLPDPLTRAGISLLVGRTRRRLAGERDRDPDFARSMVEHPIAEHTDAANDQHYELPPAFFGHVLGPRRKYSCCLYPTGRETLAEAELLALEETVAHAGLADGQHILELGCGWGSLTLFMAERFPNARITAVSNSSGQRLHIEAEAARRGLSNVTVVTADMNGFAPSGLFDRVVSVEMFEHMSNWRALLALVRSWIAPDGRLFLHVFSHERQPYRFDHRNPQDWIAQHFFTGGIMPSHRLIRQFSESFAVEDEWRWNGTHYRRTADNWLENFDARRAAIDPILESVYGGDAALWARRWRLFFLATAGLFGHAEGREWGVSHYRLRPRSA